jgi:threonine synthase
MITLRCIRCDVANESGRMGACPACGGILQPGYGDAAVSTLVSIPPGRGIDRYRATLPAESPLPYLGEGNTPLIRSRIIGPKLGLDHLYFKNEGLNPSGAFKDRAGALVAALARDAGARGVITASSGNASSAISSYCAAAGLDCYVLMEPGNPPAKLRQTLAMGATVIPVEGIFSRGPEAVSELMLDVAGRTGLYLAFVWAPVNPYILEGIKTISYEIAAQLTTHPEVVVAPAGGGDMLTAQWRGYLELEQAGVIDQRPRMVAVQSFNAPPLLEAFRQGADSVATLPSATSAISGINVSFCGDHALAAVYESGGLVAGVHDEEILAMQGRLAREEGIWVEPVGAAGTASLRWLVEQGELAPEQRVVCILSGAGFKDQELAADLAQATGRLPAAPFDARVIADKLFRHEVH